MLQLPPEELAAFELTVVRAAEIHEEKSFRGNGLYTRVFHLADFSSKPEHSNFTVKYTDHVVIVKEFEAIQRLYDLVANSNDDDAPLVPHAVHYFHPQDGSLLGYIVMERIQVLEVSDEELTVAAAKAVRWMHAQRMNQFGSLGGANTSHSVFQGGRAPEPFTSVSAAQTYLNVVRLFSSQTPFFLFSSRLLC